MEPKLNIWIRYLLPLFLALFLGSLIWLMAQFREPPGFAWYGLAWFVCTIYAIWEFGWWISRRLDREIPWQKGTFKRLMIQLAVINLAGLFIFDGTFVLLNWYENSVLLKDNPLALIHILVASGEAFIIVQILSSIQLGFQLLSNWQLAREEAEQLRKEKAIDRLQDIRRQIGRRSLTGQFEELETTLSESPEQAAFLLQQISSTFDGNLRELDGQLEGVQEELKVETLAGYPAKKHPPSDADRREIRYKTRFLVRSGPRFVVVPLEQIAGFYKDEIVLLISRNGKKFPVDTSLEELESRLPPLHFFRINRQCIVHVVSVQEVRTDGSQLALTMEVDFPKALYVSQRNIGNFKKWLDGE